MERCSASPNAMDWRAGTMTGCKHGLVELTEACVVQVAALLSSIVAGLSNAHYPRGTCIYAVRQDATFLYIGKTVNPVWQRVRGHLRSDDALGVAARTCMPASAAWRVQVCNFLGESGPEIVERELIRHYRPLLNQAHTTGRPLTVIEELQLQNRTVIGPSCRAVLDSGWPSFLGIALETPRSRR
jgi:hypothetical protein